MATVASQGRGRGRGRGWLGNLKPKQCIIKPEDTAVEQSYDDADEKEINEYVIKDGSAGYVTQTSVEEISEKIASTILNDQEESNNIRKLSNDKNTTHFSDFRNKVLDEKPSYSTNQNTFNAKQSMESTFETTTDLNSKLDFILKADAQEFIPLDEKVSAATIPLDEKVTEYYATDESSEEDTVLNVLNDVIMTLIDDPGEYEQIIDNLTDHLRHFVTQEKTLKEVVGVIITQAINYPNFRYTGARLSQHFDQSKIIELENGVTFRRAFFKRCQDNFNTVKKLVNDTLTESSTKRITNTALWFGELLCNMRIKDKPNPLYRKVVFDFVDMFLENGSIQLISCLTRLLKLVGPGLDIDRPKDVETVFNKIKDFYLDTKRSGHLPQPDRANIWKVFKLHSRDWDRSSSAPSSPAVTEGGHKFFLPVTTQYALQEQNMHAMKSGTSSSSSNRNPSPVDWNDYYTGDDVDIYKNYMTVEDLDLGEDDEECDAYEEFLRMSGQV